MAATFRLAMAPDTNNIEDRNPLAPGRLRHCGVSRGLPRPPMLSLSMFALHIQRRDPPPARTLWHVSSATGSAFQQTFSSSPLPGSARPPANPGRYFAAADAAKDWLAPYLQ